MYISHGYPALNRSLAPNLAACVADTDIKEYQTFQLLNHRLDSFVSKLIDKNLIVAGVSGDKIFQQLEFCFVTTEGECNPPSPTNCLLEDGYYRMRVHSPVQGYVDMDRDGYLRIIQEFCYAYGVSVLKAEGEGHYFTQSLVDSDAAITTTLPGETLFMGLLNSQSDLQRFDLVASVTINKDVECECFLPIYIHTACWFCIFFNAFCFIISSFVL